MDTKIAKDATREDHYIQIVAGFKVIYNQNQYLIYTEYSKKKKNISTNIYFGRLSLLGEKYLLFKCDTEAEKMNVLPFVKAVLLKEENEEIEPIDYSKIERINVVSFNELDDKMDKYPDFFTLPEKEETDIELPKFLVKKKEEKQDKKEAKEEKNKEQEVEKNKEQETEKTVDTSIDEKKEEPSQQKTPKKVEASVTIPIVNEKKEELELPSLEEVTEKTDSKEIVKSNSEIKTEEVEESMEPQNLGIVPEAETLPKMEKIEPKKKESKKSPRKIETHQPKKKRKTETNSRISIFILASIAIALMILLVVVYMKGLSMPDNKPTNPGVSQPSVQNLHCTLENNTELTHNQISIIFVYGVTNRNIVSTKIEHEVKINDAENYEKIKETLLFEQKPSTEGVKIAYTFNDEKLSYHLLEERNYSKALEEEKDETWFSNIDEAYRYYKDLGYACSELVGNNPDIEKPKTITLTSKTGSSVIDYNDWLVTVKSITLDSKETTMTITLEVENKIETRVLNGILDLLDENNQVLRHLVIQKEIKQGTEELVFTIPKEDTTLIDNQILDFYNLKSYFIELYR